MIDVRELTAGVHFSDETILEKLHFDEQRGFLVMEDQLAARGLSIVGFGGRPGQAVLEAEVTPITRFADVPLDKQDIDTLGKGVGLPRMYNTPQGPTSSKRQPALIGAYKFEVEPKDLRVEQGNRITQVLRHGSRMLRTFRPTTEGHRRAVGRLVERIHQGYGDVDAVLLTSPTRAALRQIQHGERNRVDVSSEFILVRNPAITLHLIGQYTPHYH